LASTLSHERVQALCRRFAARPSHWGAPLSELGRVVRGKARDCRQNRIATILIMTYRRILIRLIVLTLVIYAAAVVGWILRLY
jgi:hypothetical protein